MIDQDLVDAELIWRYHRMDHELRPCDVAIGLGSHDLGVATHAAGLFRAGMVPVLVFSGATSPTTQQRFPRGEAEHYREHAVELGVPVSAILVEPHATNTGANITLSREVLAAAGLHPRSALLISKPYMERRATHRIPPAGFRYHAGRSDRRGEGVPAAGRSRIHQSTTQLSSSTVFRRPAVGVLAAV